MEKIGLAAVLDMSDFDSNMAKYNAALAHMDKTTADAAGKVGQQFVGLGDAVNKAALVVGTAFVAATAAATAALAKFTGDGIEKAADLEKQMGSIAAVMSRTKDEVAPLKNLIKDLALDPTLKVNTTEAADAIEMLGRNGLTMGQILDGAARSTVLLANATEADFGTAADIATDVMALFNIEAKDMNTAVDGITSVVNNSKFSIDDYRLAIAQGGGVAASVGVEFDDFNTTIAATAPLFGSGSDAGTSFKTFLQRLVPDTDKAAGAMMDLGLFTGMTKDQFEKAEEKIAKYEAEMAKIDPTSKNAAAKQAELAAQIDVLKSSLQTGQNAFFHVDGSMRSMEEIAGLLQDAMSGLSEEQKIQAASTIFGTDAMRTAVGLANVGNEQFLALKTTMGDTSAEEAAATRMDNFSGTMEILQGVIEAVQIKIGERFLPALRTLAERLTALVTENEEKLLTFFGGVAGWVGEKIPLAMDWLVQTGLPTMAQAFNYLTDTVFPGIAGAIAWATENWDFLSGAIKVLAGVLVTASLVSTFAGIVTAITPLITLITGAGGLVASMTGAGGIAAALVGLLNPVGLVVAAVGGLALAWATDFGGIRTGTIAQVTYIGGLLYTFGASIQTSITTAIGNARTSWDTGWDNISAKVSSAAATIGASVSTFGSSLQTAITTAIGNTRTSWVAGWDNISAKVSSAAATIGASVSSLGGNVQGALNTAMNNARTSWDTGWGNISARVSSAAGTISSAVSSLGGNVQGALNTAMNSALSSWGSAWENIRSTISNKAYDIAAAARSAGSGAVDTLRSGWESGTGMFARAVQSVAGSISGYFEEKSNHWLTAGRNVIEGVSTGISNRAGGLYAQMQSVASSVLNTFKTSLGIRSPSEVFAEAGYNIAAGLAQGITEGQGLVSEAMARLQNQTQLELNQYSAMVDNQLAATIARYQQGSHAVDAAGQIVQGFDQGQYAAFWAALQSGSSYQAAAAAGQAVPRTPPSAGSTGGGAAPATGGGAESGSAWEREQARQAAYYAAHPLEDWRNLSPVTALQSLGLNMDGALTTWNGFSQTGWSNAEATARLEEVADLVTKVLGGDFSKLTDALTKIREFAPENRFGNDVQVKLGVLQQQMIAGFAEFQANEEKARQATIATSSLGALLGKFGGQRQLSADEIAARKAVAAADIQPNMMALDATIENLKSRMQELDNAYDMERNRLLGQGLSPEAVTAALNQWLQANGNQQQSIAAFSQLRDAQNQRGQLDSLLAERMAQIDAESVTMATPEVSSITKILQNFAASTLGTNISDFMADLGNKFSNLYGGISQRLGNAEYFGIDTGGLQQSAIVEAAKTLFTAGGETIFSTIDNALSTLLNYRSVAAAASLENTDNRTDGGWGAPQLTAAISDIASALRQMQAGTTFNVAFQGSAGANADVLTDIQFLNSLYATP